MRENLKNIVKEIRSIKLAKDHLAKLRTVRQQQKVRLSEIEKKISDNLTKIDRLSRTTLFSLYQKLFGEQEQLLELYKKHYLDLMLEYNELNKSVEKLDFEIDVLSKRSNKYKEVIRELKAQLRIRERDIQVIKLRDYRRLIKKIDGKLGLIKELEEAIREGSNLNRKFNAAIRFVENKAKELYNNMGDLDAMINHRVKKIDHYQDHLIAIQHSMIKFDAELSDVYREILKDKEFESKIGDQLMREYRINLVNDLDDNESLNNSHQFLKNQKSMIMSLTRTLRKDLKKLKKEVIELEQMEEEIIGEL